MSERTVLHKEPRPGSGLRWWPAFVGGLLLPIASLGLRRWLRPDLAAGLAFFVLFSLVGLLIWRSPPTRSRRPMWWLWGALIGAIIYGILTYLMPWG
jgi:hypothetical protein